MRWGIMLYEDSEGDAIDDFDGFETEADAIEYVEKNYPGYGYETYPYFD